MKTTDDYYDYPALDAPEHLTQALRHFFKEDRNKYKFAIAHRHYEELTKLHSYVDSKRISKIISGTNLVMNKLVTSYKTDQGYRYLIKKDYLQTVQRMIRNENRAKIREDERNTPAKSAKKSPFIQAMKELQDTSDEDTSADEKETDKIPVTENFPTPRIHNTDSDEQENLSFDTDVTQHAADLERDMELAMKDLELPEDETEQEPKPDHLTPLVKSIIAEELQPFFDQLTKQTNQVTQQHDTYIKKSEELDGLIKNTKILQTKTKSQYDNIELKLSFLQRKLSECDTIFEQLKLKMTSHKEEISNDENHLHNLENKFKRRLNRLKDTSTKMFEQQDNDNDILHGRLLQVENSLKKIQSTHRSTSIPRTLFHDDSTGNDDSISNQKDPSMVKKEKYQTPSHTQKRFNQSTGPNMEYLRKNVHMTCSDQDQILEFYIKLRLAVAKGGIHLVPIEDIKKSGSIAQRSNTPYEDDKQIQSQALFTLLSNENFIPNDFVMAQNCLLAYASNMDGFGALKAMLKLTHPILTMKRPPATAPTLSESSDIHTYEQALKNFFLLHKLFNNQTYSPLEKAKQFIHGMDDDQYADAVVRIRHQLDTVQTMNVTLHDDYTIENITSTIINITNEYENSKTIVRTMRRQQFNPTNNSSRSTNIPPPNNAKKFSPRHQRFTKAQCHACKQYGHIVTHCTLLPKVIAINQFIRRNSDKCDYLLKQYIRSNSLDSKKTFVRTLQGINALPDDENSDHYMDEDVIIHTMIDNAISPDNVILSDE